MAKYGVTYACGHAGTLELFGPYAERQATLAREARRLCRTCWEAQRAAEAPAPDPSLPVLTGSPKQIAWAERIRREQLAAIDALLAQSAIRDVGMRDKVLAALRGQTAASWWIDRRLASALALLEEISRSVVASAQAIR